MVNNVTVSNIKFCPSKKEYHFLKINLSNMIVLKFHMLLLYIYHQTVSKQCFLGVKVGIKVMYIFKL